MLDSIMQFYIFFSFHSQVSCDNFKRDLWLKLYLTSILITTFKVCMHNHFGIITSRDTDAQ